jgi:hypothetical protein
VLSVFNVITFSGKSISEVQVLTFQEISTPKLCQCLLFPHILFRVRNFIKMNCVLSERKPTHNFSFYRTNTQQQTASNDHITMHTKLKMYMINTMFSLLPTCVAPKLLLCSSPLCYHLCQFLFSPFLHRKYCCIHWLSSTVCIVSLLSALWVDRGLNGLGLRVSFLNPLAPEFFF